MSETPILDSTLVVEEKEEGQVISNRPSKERTPERKNFRHHFTPWIGFSKRLRFLFFSFTLSKLEHYRHITSVTWSVNGSTYYHRGVKKYELNPVISLGSILSLVSHYTHVLAWVSPLIKTMVWWLVRTHKSFMKSWPYLFLKLSTEHEVLFSTL